MDNNKALNEFVQQYYGQLASLVYKDPVKLSSKETALVIIDAQKCVTKEYFIEGYKALGVDTEPLMPVLNQLEENTQAALANIQRILYKCREVGITPIHVRIQSLLPDARDTGRLHASAGMYYPPGGMASEFCDEVKPLDGDQCVSTSIRDLSDAGYEVDMIEDAMAAMSQERHEKALQSTKFIYANCEKTEDLLARMNALNTEKTEK